MSAVLGFEQKIQGLIDYYEALDKLDPRSPQHNELANPGFFYYAEGHSVSSPLQEVRLGVISDLESHGRREYWERGLHIKDLREDTDESRNERADVLAVITAPLTVEQREKRTERIAGLLKDITSGKTIRLTKYDTLSRTYYAPEELGVDVSRAIFGVFRNSHISSRKLTIQYDSPNTFASNSSVVIGEPVMSIELPDLFRRTVFTDTPKLIAETVNA